MKDKKRIWLFLNAIVCIIFLMNCGGNKELVNVIDEPTSTPCPEVTPVPIVIPNTKMMGKLVFVLVDNSTSYRSLYSDHDYALNSLELLINILPNTIAPGDELYVSWIGYLPEDPYRKIYSGRLPLIEYPTNPSFPSSLTFPQPEPTVIVSGTSTKKSQQIGLNEEISSSNAIQLNNFFCEQIEQNQEIEYISAAHANKWEEANAAELNEFLYEAIAGLENAKNQSPDRITLISEGLYLLSRRLDEDSTNKTFESIKLILFSDMQETRYSDLNVQINLPGVDVLVANMYCIKVDDCYEQEEIWLETFSEMNVRSINFLYVFQTNEKSLLDFLK